MITGADVLADRQRRGLSRTKYAELLGLTPTKVSNIEHGREIRPDEQAILQQFIVPVPVATTVGPAPTEPTGGSAVVFILDPDEEMLWIDPDPVVTSQVAPEPVSPVAAAPGNDLPGVAVQSSPNGEVDLLQFRTPPPLALTEPTSVKVGIDALYTEDGLRRISNSELQSFKACRRMWWLSWYRGLRLTRQKRVGAAPLGDRIHRALAQYYVPPGSPGQRPEDALEDIIREDEAKLVTALQDTEAGDAATELTNFQKEADLARAMIEGYTQWIAETGIDSGYVVDGSEQQLSADFKLPGDLPDVRLVGRLDVRVRREHDDARLFLDHKTVGNFDQPTRLLPLDEQMKTYHLLEDKNRNPGDPPVIGALYNMIRKVKRTATAKPPFYQRVEVHRNPHEISRMEQRIIGESVAMGNVERSLKNGVDHHLVAFPRPSGDCLWKCPFVTICPMFDDNSRAEAFIEDHYTAGNPLDRYDNEVEEDA